MNRVSVVVALCALALLVPGGEGWAEESPGGDASESESLVSTQEEESRWELGAVVLLNLSNVDFRAVENPFSVRMGLGGGVQGRVSLWEGLFVQTEVLYGQRGMRAELRDLNRINPSEEEEEEVVDLVETQVYNFHILQVPLLLGWSLGLGENYGVGVQVGATASVFLGRTRTNDQGTFETTREGLVPMTFGLAAGLGVDRKMGRGRGSVEVRYDRDLSSFLEVQEGVEEGAVHWAMSLLIGYRFGL